VKVIENYQKLHYLDLSNNRIKSIQFKKFYNLEIVSVSQNELKTIDSLFDLSYLRSINFSHNKIESIDKRLLMNSQSHIFEIDLKNNCLISIEFDCKINRLKNLDLSFNQLEFVKFKSVKHVSYSKLNNNNLRDFDNFKNITFDKLLDISNNNYEKIEFSSEFNELNELKIDGNNRLNEINGFENLRELKFVQLKRDQLDLFKNIRNLRLKAKRFKHVFLESLYLNFVNLNNLFDEAGICEIIVEFLSRNIHVDLLSFEKVEKFINACKFKLD
jgi:hypothetical protein